jgi:hypothetical protein
MEESDPLLADENPNPRVPLQRISAKQTAAPVREGRPTKAGLSGGKKKKKTNPKTTNHFVLTFILFLLLLQK